MLKKTVTIQNKLGLHARAASKLVSEASRHTATVHLRKGEQDVNGKSIMGVMMLAATCGTELELTVDGDDEQEAMDRLVDLVNRKFDEKE